MMTSSRIILVRHGEVEGIQPARFRGRADLALTPHGIEQAQLTRDYLAKFGAPAAIYASPLARCQDTARILAQPYHLTPGYTPELNDIDYGGWQGRSYEEIERSDPERFKVWMTSPDKADIPGGEGLAGAARRADRAWRMALARHPDSTSVLVSHDCIIRLILLAVLEIPQQHYWCLEQSPCGVSVMTHQEFFWQLNSMNETAHLQSPTLKTSATPGPGGAATSSKESSEQFPPTCKAALRAPFPTKGHEALKDG